MKNKYPVHQLIIENWGPVKRGKITFKPLTIFIGPNNTGKSYVAMLYYALIRSIKKLLSTYYLSIDSETIESVRNKSEFLQNRLEKDISEYIVNKKLTIIREIERIFSSNINELIRTGSNRSRITMKLRNRNVKINLNIVVESSKEPSMEVNVKLEKSAHSKVNEMIERVIKKFNLTNKDTEEFFIELISLEHLIEKAVGENIYYLPASRAGVLHSYRNVAYALIQIAPLAAIRGAEVPRFPGPLADFISTLISIEPVTNKINRRILDILEKINNIVEGKVELETKEENLPPEIAYFTNGTRVPISRTSSMIAELAPLNIYLRYGVLGRNDILVIEEPEAHLHPDKQAKLAELFASLINILNIRTIITTHSDILLSRTSDLVSLSILPESKLAEIGYNRELVLNPNEVAVYNFSKENNGTIVEKIDINTEGIREDVFHKIIEELYEESMKIYYKVQEYVKKSHKSGKTENRNSR